MLVSLIPYPVYETTPYWLVGQMLTHWVPIRNPLSQA
jgi:hypothetical protein